MFLNTWLSFGITTPDSSLLERINKLEARLAKLENPQEIKTNKLIILDKKGREVINMMEDNNLGNAQITMYNYNNDKKTKSVSINSMPQIALGEPPSVFITEHDYVPNFIEWCLLKFVAENNSQRYLTDNLILISISTYEKLQIREKLESDLNVFVNTIPQPNWEKYYLGNGKFNLADREVKGEYLDAGNNIVKMINNYINTSNLFSHIIINFAVRGSEVGVWTDGIMKLKGE